MGKRRGVKRVVHPDAGELRIAFEALLLPDEAERRLITSLPADSETAERVSGLLDAEPVSPAKLRIVG